MLEIHPGIVNVIDTKSQNSIGHVDYQTLLGYNEDGTYFFIKDDKGYAVVTLDGQRKDLPKLDNIAPSSGAVSPDGKQVAVFYTTTEGNLDYYSQIGVFAVDTGNQIKTINIYSDAEVHNIQFSLDDQYLYFNVSGGFNNGYLLGANTAYIYRTSDWKAQISFPNTDSSPILSPDSTLAALFLDDQIEIWDIATKKAISHINDQVSSASSFLFTPDSQKIVVLTPQKSLSVWNISDKKLLQRTTTDLKTLNSVSIDNNGQILSVGGKPIPWQYSIGRNAEFAFSSDSKEIHSAVYGYETASVGFVTKEEVCTIRLQQDATCQSFYPNPGNGNLYPYHEVMVGTDGEFYTVSGLNGVLSIQGGVDGTGKPLTKVNLGDTKSSPLITRYPLLLVPQQTFFVFSQQGETVSGYVAENINTNKQITLDVYSFPCDFLGRTVQCTTLVLVASEDGSRLATLASKDNKISIINLGTLEVQSTVTPATSDTADTHVETTLALSPDGGQLAYITTLTDKTSKTVSGQKLNVVNTSNGENVFSVDLSIDNYKFDQNVPFFTDLKYSPDGKLLALSAMNSNIYLIDSSTGKVLNTISVPAPALRLAFSPDGTLLASAHGAGGVDLWGVTP